MRRHPPATPVPAGLDPEQRIKLAVELAAQALACMTERPAQATDMLKEAQPRTDPCEIASKIRPVTTPQRLTI